MSDGYRVYRELNKRLRCWAHLQRKAKGIAESLDKDAAEFGKQAREVIMRKITYGTRSDEGTRVFALLASVIDTCRLRDVSPWRYLELVIKERRSGRDVPPLPIAKKTSKLTYNS